MLADLKRYFSEKIDAFSSRIDRYLNLLGAGSPEEKPIRIKLRYTI